MESVELARPAGVVLWARFAESRDTALREDLILQYQPLVKYAMRRIALRLPRILDYDDILSYGTIGLIEAVERFDPSKGLKFETYALSRVRGAIIDAMRRLGPLSRGVIQKARQAEAAISQLTGELGRSPTSEEVAQALGITVARYRQIRIDASRHPVSLETASARDDYDDGPGEISVADPDAEAVGDALERAERIGELDAAILTLSARSQLLLSRYYKTDRTMREISKELGVSESRVCQLHAAALVDLRVSMMHIRDGHAA